jgi:hypothetical protein
MTSSCASKKFAGTFFSFALESPKGVTMDRYLVESPHDAGDCDAIIKEIHAAGYLHHFEWGCHDGAHCGWAIIETDNREHAKQIVPWRIRNKARVIKLETFGSANKTHSEK